MMLLFSYTFPCSEDIRLLYGTWRVCNFEKVQLLSVKARRKLNERCTRSSWTTYVWASGEWMCSACIIVNGGYVSRRWGRRSNSVRTHRRIRIFAIHFRWLNPASVFPRWTCSAIGSGSARPANALACVPTRFSSSRRGNEFNSLLLGSRSTCGSFRTDSTLRSAFLFSFRISINKL